jgi:hypothetical protein
VTGRPALWLVAVVAIASTAPKTALRQIVDLVLLIKTSLV